MTSPCPTRPAAPPLTTRSPHPVDDADPLISVVIAARNAAATLDQTLWSVRRQSYPRWELIVVDDGSIDGTGEVVRRHQREDPRIRQIAGAAQGVSAARNLGAAHAEGSLLAFLDADDLWLPGKLQAHMRFLRTHAKVGLAFDRVRFVDANARPTPVQSTRRVNHLTTVHLLRENPACTASTLVVRKRVFDVLGGFDPDLRHAEDLELMLRISASPPWRVQGLGEVHTHYRTNAQGASADLQRMQDGWDAVLAKVLHYAPQLSGHDVAAARAVHLRYLARRALRLRLPAPAGLHWWRSAWRASPHTLLEQPLRSLGTLAALLALGAWQQLRATFPSLFVHTP